MTGMRDVELLQACRTLFGESASLNSLFLDALQLTDLKKTFRRRSLETHPDRYLHLGFVNQRAYSELFQQVREAYEKLCGYLRLRSEEIKNQKAYAPWPPPPPPASRAAAHPMGSSFSGGFKDADLFDPVSFYKAPGPMPPWRLRLGEFLFYNGVISWDTLISALLWQGRQRERLGSIVMRWGWLKEAQLTELLHERRIGEQLGSILLRRQIITPFQLKMLLIHQRQKQPRIGEFFVGQGIIPPFHLPPLVDFLRERNRRFENAGKTLHPIF